MPATARVAIFDLDGTLVDSREDLAEAGNAARAALGLPELPIATVAGFVGDGAARLIERLTPEADRAAREGAMTAFLDRYARVCTRRTRPYDGVPAMLDRLRAAGWRLAVATNKPERFTREILAACALPVDALRGGDRIRKPDPAPLVELIAELGGERGGAWMVGDHHTDLAAGAAAGVRTLWCAWGMGRRDGLPADAEAATPAEVAERILAAP